MSGRKRGVGGYLDAFRNGDEVWVWGRVISVGCVARKWGPDRGRESCVVIEGRLGEGEG